ncbi:MAG: hypothetical protein AAGF12_41970 [Myxococcota bacterium]
MASETRTFDLPLAGEQAYPLIRDAGVQLPGFDREAERQAEGFIKFVRVLGWSNPMGMEVQLQVLNEQATRVQLTAKLLALADPMGFMKGALDMFEGHITACAHAAAAGQPWPAPPSHDKKGAKSTVILLGILALIMVPIFAFLVLVILMR